MTTVSVLLEFVKGYGRARYWWRFRTREDLERHQQIRLRRFMATTLRRSPYYAAKAGGPLADLPIMTKAIMNAQFDAINTRGIRREAAMAIALAAETTRDVSSDLGGISVGLSTGTSGQRGLFLASPAERMRWAGIILGRMLPKGLLHRHRIAFLLRTNNALYETVSGRGRITFQFFDLMAPLDAHMAKLRTFNPTMLIAPAQVLRLLAHREAADRAGGASERLMPDRIISVAEVLFDDDRTLIEQVFGRRVDQIYQCTEGFLGYTCAHGGLHLNEAFLHIEPDWLDAERTRFSPLVTDFSRDTQPIVRYRLDDVLTIAPEPCACGSPERRVSRIEGRADDILVLPGRQDNLPIEIMPDYIVRSLAGAELDDFRVVQRDVTQLDIEIAAPDYEPACQRAGQALLGLFDRLGVVQPSLQFAPFGPHNLLAKRRRVLRMGVAP
jgi:putative adenylate-forming enzyme